MKLLAILLSGFVADVSYSFVIDKDDKLDVCGDGKETHYAADPKDCHYFYACIYDPRFDSFHTEHMKCPDGLAFVLDILA